MKKRKVFVLHEFFMPTHYLGLKYLCDSTNIELCFYEIPSLRVLIKSLCPPFRNLNRNLRNFLFIFSLPFKKNEKILLGIAPYNFKLFFLSFFLKRHMIYLHTSYTCWDGSRSAHRSLFFIPLRKFWKKYINCNISHIFAVSKKVKEELVKNGFSSSDKISIVNHSYKEDMNNEVWKSDLSRANKYLYVGRLETCKGIQQLLDYFEKNRDLIFNIVGSGSLSRLVENYSIRCKNIRYLGFISEWVKLQEIYKNNSFLLLNSQKEGGWEELFGMTIIEAMHFGCIPICTDHSGPKEIIKDSIDGFIFEEKKFIESLPIIRDLKGDSLQEMRMSAYRKSKNYSIEETAKKWVKILN